MNRCTPGYVRHVHELKGPETERDNEGLARGAKQMVVSTGRGVELEENGKQRG